MPRTKKAARLKRLQAQDRDQAPHHSSPDPHQTMSNHNPQTSANMQFTTKVKPSRNERRKKRKNTRKAVLHKPANPSIPPKDSCPFLEAPAEIRVEIYRHLMEFYCLLLHIGSAYNDEETGGYHRGFPLIHRPINMQQVLTTLLTCSTIRSELFPVIAESAYVRVVAKGCKWTDLPKYFRRNILPKVQQAEILAFSSWFPFSMMKGLKKVVLTGEDVQVATPLRIEKSTIEELVPYLVGDQDQMLFDEHIRNCLRADEDSSKPSRANLLFKVQELSKQGVEVHIACRVKLLMSIVEEGTHVSRVPITFTWNLNTKKALCRLIHFQSLEPDKGMALAMLKADIYSDDSTNDDEISGHYASDFFGYDLDDSAPSFLDYPSPDWDHLNIPGEMYDGIPLQAYSEGMQNHLMSMDMDFDYFY